MKVNVRRLRALEYNVSSPTVSQETRWRAWDAIATMPWRGSVGSVDFETRMLKAVGDVARAWKGECLSTGFDGHQAQLLFACVEGHRFGLLPRFIRQGAWCPECAHRRYLDEQIDEMRTLAAQYGGLCLSSEYRGTNVPLLWRCAHGKEWEALRREVRRGQWCSCLELEEGNSSGSCA
jgi:hypothetical protein